MNNTAKEAFEYLVARERQRQDQKWGEQNHEAAFWLAIMVEEVGEVASEVIAGGWKPELQRRRDLGHELVQVAAVCKAMYESLERNGQL